VPDPDPTPTEQLRVEVGPFVLDAVATGPPDGPKVVLLHGFPQDSWCWRGVWPGLAAAGYRVVVPDLRGYSPGARPAGIEPYRMTHLVGDVLAVAGPEPVHLVGHDWGAAIAWQLAARHPDRLRTLTALSVPHPLAFVEALQTDPDQQARSQYMRDWSDPGTEQRLLDEGLRSTFAPVPEVDTDHYLARLSQPGAMTAALNYYRAQSRADLEGIGAVRVPTLHVWSDDDPALGRAATLATRRFVEGPYRLEVLPGVSHWIPEQAPEQVVRLLLEHVVDGPRPGAP